MTTSLGFEWKWCRLHDAPLISKEEGWACYWPHYLPPAPRDVTIVRIQHVLPPDSEGSNGQQEK